MVLRGPAVGELVLLAAGLAVGLSLGVFGAGGSALAIPALIHLGDMGFLAASTGALAVVAGTAGVGAWRHHRAGRVRWGTAAVVGLGSSAAAVAGSLLARILPEAVLQGTFAALLVAVAVHLWRRPTQATPVADEPSGGQSRALGGRRRVAGGAFDGHPRALGGRGRVAVVAIAVGLLTGLLGVGGGFIIVPALVVGLELSFPDAVGTSLAVILMSASIALVARPWSVVPWGIVAPFAGAAVLGVLLGSRIRVPDRVGHRAFALLLVALSVRAALDAVAAVF